MNAAAAAAAYMCLGFILGYDCHKHLLGIPVEDWGKVDIQIKVDFGKVALGCAIVIVFRSVSPTHTSNP